MAIVHFNGLQSNHCRTAAIHQRILLSKAQTISTAQENPGRFCAKGDLNKHFGGIEVETGPVIIWYFSNLTPQQHLKRFQRLGAFAERWQDIQVSRNTRSFLIRHLPWPPRMRVKQFYALT